MFTPKPFNSEVHSKLQDILQKYLGIISIKCQVPGLQDQTILAPWPQLDTWPRMAYTEEHLVRLGQSELCCWIWNLGGWPIMCRPSCCGWWLWEWGTMFSAMWLQETEKAGAENRPGTRREAGTRDSDHIVCSRFLCAFLSWALGHTPCQSPLGKV